MASLPTEAGSCVAASFFLDAICSGREWEKDIFFSLAFFESKRRAVDGNREIVRRSKLREQNGGSETKDADAEAGNERIQSGGCGVRAGND